MSNENDRHRSRRDWRDESSYDDLRQLDRRGFAWEYLRRNERYREQTSTAFSVPMDLCDGVPILRAHWDERAESWGVRFRGTTLASRYGGTTILA